MAVVQISKIQHRRGRSNAGTGLPQLASGELGWAIDSQELFIGNGSVAEGSPYVGNTKVITEHDNILDLALQYQYKRIDASITTGPSSAQPIQRTVQQRLDDVVSARSFGTVGDGVIDDTAALQRALDQLYLNDATKGAVSSRITLVLEAGEFLISAALRIPPYASIQGAGKDKTIIRQIGNYPVAYTVNSSSIPGAYDEVGNLTSLNQPTNISIAGLTLKQTVVGYPVLRLNSTKNSQFKNVKLHGVWTYPTDTITAGESALILSALSASVSCTDNTFDNCDFMQMSVAVDSTFDIESNTFSNCNFAELGRGLELGLAVDGVTAGKLYGPQKTVVTDSKFFMVKEVAYDVQTGIGNLSNNNKYIEVGNDGGTEGNAVYNVINFSQGGNISANDYFSRSMDLTDKEAYINTVAYIGEVSGVIKSEHKFNNEIYIRSQQVGSPFIRLTADDSVSHIIHYFYKSLAQAVTRQGTLHVNIDRINDTVQITDDCSVIGNSANYEKLSFAATLEDVNLDTTIDTVYIRYTNSATTENGYINYWYETLS
jgi:hypothetical protein